VFAVLARCAAGALEGPRGERLVERADLAGEHSHLSGVIPADGVITGGERIALGCGSFRFRQFLWNRGYPG
jgi:hypothetical protein